jgi:hypothetical protein
MISSWRRPTFAREVEKEASSLKLKSLKFVPKASIREL